jgi:hypothetical protein
MRIQNGWDLLLFRLLRGLRKRGLGNGEYRAQGSLELIEGGLITHAGHRTISPLWGLQ